MNNPLRSNMESSPAAKLATGAERYVGQAADAAHKNVDKMTDAAHPAVDRLSTQAHETINAVEGAAGQAVNTVDQASRRVAQGLEQVKATHQRAVTVTRERVRDNPLAMVTFAAALGYIVGRVAGRR